MCHEGDWENTEWRKKNQGTLKKTVLFWAFWEPMCVCPSLPEFGRPLFTWRALVPFKVLKLIHFIFCSIFPVTPALMT